MPYLDASQLSTPYVVDLPPVRTPPPLVATTAETRAALASLDEALTTLQRLVPDGAAPALDQATAAAAWVRRLLRLDERGSGRILLADDDGRRAESLQVALAEAGYTVDRASDPESVRVLAESRQPQVVLISLGIVSGATGLFESIRAGCNAGVVVLAGRVGPRTIGELLQHGAQDYVTDPVTPLEVVQRVGAMLRRPSAERKARIDNGPLSIELTTRTVTLAGKEVQLTPTEYSLLYHLAIESGRVLTHEQLLERVWGEQYAECSDYLWVHLSRLRRKLRHKGQPDLIVTERGVGYRLRIIPSAQP